ncbi:MAG: hypothetical protein MUO72_10065 [Bacteroidales bacterium]|nr:hypothetical protein [Bacteroidales bacterium]
MNIKERDFIYLNCLDFSGTVFQTQVLDWLNLYRKYGVKFELIQVFRIKEIIKPGYIKQQLAGIHKSTNLFKGFLFLLPSKGLFAIINTIIIYLKIFRHLIQNDEVLIFSRALIGKEIKYLRKITKCKIIFYYDARAASAEEKKYIAIKQQNFTRSKYLTIANVYYLEYQTILSANKIFSVSNVLMNYFINTFAAAKTKFVNYPSLSDLEKFYYDSDLRLRIRNELGVRESTLVFIYSGGIANEWHVSEQMFAFFNELNNYKEDLFFMFLTKDKAGVEKALVQYPALKQKLISFSVPNNEVCKYLNAADFGILFRENTIMNNVASPTKFAEYMLCGLPVIISEGVGDYSTYTVEKEVGFLLKETELKYPDRFNFNSLINMKFERNRIAELGKQHFSKQSIIKYLIDQFRI